MAPPLLRLGRLLSELKRRKVYQVAALYAVLSVGGLELLDLLVPSTQLPDWSGAFFLGLAVVGLPIVIVLGWMFDLTPSGVVRTTELADIGNAPSISVDPEESRDPLPPLDETVVAVLPFENLSGSDADPFAIGLHDDLLTELSRASALSVISRTSVRGYRGTDKTIREIAGELGAGTIVEGGVQRAGNRVRLNIQLIDARTDAHRWAERYDRELTTENIFDLQSELAARIMSALQAKLTSEEEARVQVPPTANVEAYRLYSLGREMAIERSEEAYKEAAGYFERAIELDPHYALAWAGLGAALVGLVDYGHCEPEDWLPRARKACYRSVELDPRLAEAHAAVGVLRSYQRDCPGAIDAHTRATVLRPSYAAAHQWTSWAEILIGHADAALDAALHATRLDPLDPEARGNLALARLAVGDPDRASLEARRALEQYRDFDYARWVEGLALYAMGKPQQASQTLQQVKERWARAWPDAVRALECVDRGDVPGARALADRLEREAAPFKAGIVQAAMGDYDAAFDRIERAAPLPWDETLYLHYHRVAPLAGLRTQSRFQTLMGEVNRSWGMEERVRR